MIRVEEERKRAKEALENANKKQIARMLHESLAAKQMKMTTLTMADQTR